MVNQRLLLEIQMDNSLRCDYLLHIIIDRNFHSFEKCQTLHQRLVVNIEVHCYHISLSPGQNSRPPSLGHTFTQQPLRQHCGGTCMYKWTGFIVYDTVNGSIAIIAKAYICMYICVFGVEMIWRTDRIELPPWYYCPLSVTLLFYVCSQC